MGMFCNPKPVIAKSLFPDDDPFDYESQYH